MSKLVMMCWDLGFVKAGVVRYYANDEPRRRLHSWDDVSDSNWLAAGTVCSQHG